MITGAGVSTPTTAHVPMLRNAQERPTSVTGMPATAEAVSWVAGAITGIAGTSSSRQTLCCTFPTRVPGFTGIAEQAGRDAEGTEDPLLPLPFAWLYARLVVASAYSLTASPVSRKLKRSGIIRSLSAAASSGAASSLHGVQAEQAHVESTKRPVRSNSFLAGMTLKTSSAKPFLRASL